MCAYVLIEDQILTWAGCGRVFVNYYSEGFFFWIVAYIAHIGTKGAVHEGDVLVGKGAKLDSLSLTHSPTIYIKFNYPFDELIHK